MYDIKRVVDQKIQKHYESAVVHGGLEVVLFPMKGLNTTQATIYTPFGGMDRTFLDQETGKKRTIPPGIAHLFEHLLFHMSDGRDALPVLKSLGASANASTSQDRTNYFFSTTTNFYECLKILLDFTTQGHFTQEKLDKEIKIVDREREFRQGYRATFFKNFGKAMYKEFPLKDTILGSAKDIREATPEMLRYIHSRFYAPSNLKLVVAGNQSMSELASFVDKNLKEKNLEYVKPPKPIIPEEPDEVAYRKIEATDKNVPLPLALMGFKVMYKEGEDPQQVLKQNIILDMVANTVLSQNGLLIPHLASQRIIHPSRISGGYTEGRGYGQMKLYFGDRNLERVENAITERLKEIKKTGIPGSAITLEKKGTKGISIQAYNSPSALSRGFTHYNLYGANVMDYLTILDSVTLDEVNQALSVFDLDNYAISIVRPTRKKTEIDPDIFMPKETKHASLDELLHTDSFAPA